MPLLRAIIIIATAISSSSRCTLRPFAPLLLLRLFRLLRPARSTSPRGPY